MTPDGDNERETDDEDDARDCDALADALLWTLCEADCDELGDGTPEREADAVTLRPRVGDGDSDAARDGDGDRLIDTLRDADDAALGDGVSVGQMARMTFRKSSERKKRLPVLSNASPIESTIIAAVPTPS